MTNKVLTLFRFPILLDNLTEKPIASQNKATHLTASTKPKTYLAPNRRAYHNCTHTKRYTYPLKVK